MSPIEFQAFDKIPRLFRDMVITEKIDGTNAAVGIRSASDYPDEPDKYRFVCDDRGEDECEDYFVYAQSRSRLIYPGKGTDNYGFAQWTWDNAAQLVETLGPGLHFGEWWGQGVNRGYGLTEKRFSLFNTKRWGWLNDEGARAARNVPGQLYGVPVLCSYTFDTEVIKAVGNALRQVGSHAAPGFMKPEGMVVYHAAAGQMFKYTLDGDAAKSGLELAA